MNAYLHNLLKSSEDNTLGLLEESEEATLRLILNDVTIQEDHLKITDCSGTLPKRLSRILDRLSAAEKKADEAVKLIQTIHKIEMQVNYSPYSTSWTHRDRKAISQLVVQLCEDYFRGRNESTDF